MCQLCSPHSDLYVGWGSSDALNGKMCNTDKGDSMYFIFFSNETATWGFCE